MSNSVRQPRHIKTKQQIQSYLISESDKTMAKGVDFYRNGYLKEAFTAFEQVIEIQPKNFDALQLAGLIAVQSQNYQQAVILLTKATKISSSSAFTFFTLGFALHKLNQTNDAIDNYDLAISIDPYFADAELNRGLALQELKRFDEALVSFEKTILLKPNDSEAHNNKGLALQELNKYEDAIASFSTAISINPNFTEAYYNRGIALQTINQWTEALDSYSQAYRINSNYAEAYWNKSLLLISLGQYTEGWALYEWRWKAKAQKDLYRIFKEPLWLGDVSIEDQVILIHAEQGLGDTIQFCRYIAMLDSLKPKKIILEVFKPLLGLLSSLNVKTNMIEKGHPTPAFDWQCPLMSLPHALKTTIATIPSETPYLYAEVHKTKLWQVKLGLKGKLRVGIVWSGSTTHKNDHNRSLTLKQLAPILALPFDYHSLQKEIRSHDLDTLSILGKVHQHQDDLNDFTDTAALIEQMDLVISVDTAVAHLAGAMGKTVFILLPFSSDYRWMHDRDDSPWYPTATLFRQARFGDWTSVIHKLKIILQKTLHEKKPP